MSFIRLTAAALATAALAGPLLAAEAPDERPPFPPPAGLAAGLPAGPGAGPAAGPDAGPERGAPGAGPGHRLRGPGLPFQRGIELTEAQQDRVFAIMHAQAPQLREQEKAERKAHEALDAMMESGQYDEARAAAQSRALGQAIAAQELLRLRSAAQVMALLTPQQKQALHDERDQRRPRR